MLAGVVSLSFGCLGEVQPIVHLIREDSHSRYMPTCGWTDHDPVVGTTRDLVSNLGLNPFFWSCFIN